MTRLAVDVVLLPDQAVTEQAMAINRGLVERFRSEIILDAETCLPHVSLAMGCIDPKDLDAAGRIIRQIALENPIEELTVIGVAVITLPTGQKTSSLLIDKTEPLQRLHEEVLGRLSPFFSYDVTGPMLCGSGPISDSTLAWIRDFPCKSSLDFFWPHITLGYGEASALDRPAPFMATHLALCHLGNHCTCRKLLTSVEWGGP
jgi:hypothetical protein